MGSENRKKMYEKDKINKKSNTKVSKNSSNLGCFKIPDCISRRRKSPNFSTKGRNKKTKARLKMRT